MQFDAPYGDADTSARVDDAIKLMKGVGCSGPHQLRYFDAHMALTEDDVRTIWLAEGKARGVE